MRREPSEHTRTMLGLFAAAVLACPATQSSAKVPDDGYLIVPALLDKSEARLHPGYVAPQVWVYDDTGNLLASKGARGAYEVGEKIPLAEGWYLVEVGNVQAEQNRAKLFVKSRRVTVVPTGLIVVNAEPDTAQPPDVCHRWTGKLFVYLPVDPAPGILVATNQAAEQHPTGIVQVVAGYYRIEWNRFWVSAEVKPNKAFKVPTGLVGPMPQSDYSIHAKEGLVRDNPGLRLCRKRSTRVMARTYFGTYNRQVTQYPFKQREWEQITVERPKDPRGPYQSLGSPKIPGAIYRGVGADPVLGWELAPPPDPKAPEPKEPEPKGPDSEEPDGDRDNPTKTGPEPAPPPPPVGPRPLTRSAPDTRSTPEPAHEIEPQPSPKADPEP